jgi:serine/threonine protein kinase
VRLGVAFGVVRPENDAMIRVRSCRYRYRVHGEINRRVLGKWCKQILRALCFLHELTPPVAHGDIRCDNIFIIGETGNVKVGNFCLIQPPQEDSLLGTFGTGFDGVRTPLVGSLTLCCCHSSVHTA